MQHFLMILRKKGASFSNEPSARRLAFIFFIDKKTKQKTLGFT
ncbi:MAG: hypothetical protein ACJA1A_002952 [Saprospiraceae bacterium]|jgi:hypothetical protein